ncbi:MAG: alpha-glucuronidase family glycosyl hydrolase [Bacteroidales bacterium]|jgi:alpha-glucuronidase|nr:alpha-glucuronidase family glycosyl hydrolase [Bacteroidales bacterium]
MNKMALSILLCVVALFVHAEDGYDAWLRYQPIADEQLRTEYAQYIQSIVVFQEHPTLDAASAELQDALNEMLQTEILIYNDVQKPSVILATVDKVPFTYSESTEHLGDEGFHIFEKKYNSHSCIVVTGNTEIAVLYGSFHLLRLIQTQQSITKLAITEVPTIDVRVLNHWDNLDGSVERGYAGQSIWRWFELPQVVSPRYRDYARYNSSVGINGTVLTNVNANADVLTTEYLDKVRVIADELRPYGIKVYLTARFNAPIEIGGLGTADPLDASVQEWWNKKVAEIYTNIPDFGGFLVKANSEGQPGPNDYGRSHAEGANMLARALQIYNGIVMWRAFVYSNKEPEDRAKQAYNEFKPLDGEFEKNVLIQTKNGPIDFQPREPFHPLFGAMEHTPLMMEFQITQEYLGQGFHVCYLAPLYKECLSADTYARGEGSTLAEVIDGSLYDTQLTGIAGVSNVGNDRNWTRHPLAQANWYAFGRLAWNHELTSKQIAEEWICMTFSHNKKVVNTMLDIMLQSRETEVMYTSPLGLHHQMAWHHHYGPGPWVDNKPRADWTSIYYHNADSTGIGFDRTKTGSNAVAQYYPEVQERFASLENCPEDYLLWFHHVPWEYTMNSGRTVWNELCYMYHTGVQRVEQMQTQWDSLEGYIDEQRFSHVQSLLKIQHNTACLWRDASVLYFQTFSHKPLPKWFPNPTQTLKEYKQIEYKYLPGSQF